MVITADDLLLERALRWEKERTGRVFLTQPVRGQLREWTWGQALDQARRMAAYLKAQHWEPGSRIAILSKNSAWWIMADVAIWMAGHVSVPIYPSLRAATVRQILEHSGAKACFVGAIEKEAAGAIGASGVEWIALPNAACDVETGWEGLVEANTPLGGTPVRGGDELATIIYTSGTTGMPKGVMHRFHGFAHNAKALGELLRLSAPQRTLSYLPLAHILERAGGEAVALWLGNHVFFTEGVESFLQDLARARPTLFLSVPRLLVKFQQGVFAKLPREKLDRLLRIPAVRLLVKRKILRELGLNAVYLAACGGAPLPVEILTWYRKLGVELAEGYGMSETMITHLPPLGGVRPGCVGAALAGVETEVTPEGELLVRSPMNMLGYYRDAELTRQAVTEDGFFRTGDLVAVEPDGQIRIVGRLKEQFKTSKGKFVTPAPIESRLMEHPAIEACCLMGSGQASPFAVVVLSDAMRARCASPDARMQLEASLAALMASINRDLDSAERLSMIVIADGPWTIGNGLITPTLKIRRSVVEERYQAMIEDWRTHGSAVIWESLPGSAAVSYTAGAGGPPDESAGASPS